MPIDKENMKKYPGGSIKSKEWQDIRKRILERAGNRCEGSPGLYPHCRAENYKPHPDTGSRVILTIAHLDQNRGNNRDDNLRALCQKCHLGFDRMIRVRIEQEKNLPPSWTNP